MNKNLIIAIVVAAILAIVGIVYVQTNNGLVRGDENVDAKWAQVENQLQRRSDLIPNLVSTVKGYAAHEQKVFGDVAAARSKLASAQTPAQKAEANGEVSGALSRLLMIQENYPQLKADSQFKALMDELKGTENRLTVARKDYNDSVQSFNSRLKQFPTSFIADGKFGPREYFKTTDEAKVNPKVKF